MSARRAAGPPGQVRVIAGSLRGSILAVPDSAGLRPTPGRVRETLFNWLQPVVAGAHCLDLYAGSGALGIEALSRGAAAVTFVERDAALAANLRANLARLRQDAAAVRHADALALLDETPAQACDVVFLDPPFADEVWTAACARLQGSAWLAPQAWIYIESPTAARFVLPEAWSLHRQAQAGQVRHALYRRRAVDPLS